MIVFELNSLINKYFHAHPSSLQFKRPISEMQVLIVIAGPTKIILFIDTSEECCGVVLELAPCSWFKIIMSSFSNLFQLNAMQGKDQSHKCLAPFSNYDGRDWIKHLSRC